MYFVWHYKYCPPVKLLSYMACNWDKNSPYFFGWYNESAKIILKTLDD